MTPTEVAVAQALEAVAHLAELARQAAREWIPAYVQEAPDCDWVYTGPATGQTVLVFINGHCASTDTEARKGGAWGIHKGFFDHDRHRWHAGGPGYDNMVTHWMELPAPPPRDT